MTSMCVCGASPGWTERRMKPCHVSPGAQEKSQRGRNGGRARRKRVEPWLHMPWLLPLFSSFTIALLSNWKYIIVVWNRRRRRRWAKKPSHVRVTEEQEEEEIKITESEIMGATIEKDRPPFFPSHWDCHPSKRGVEGRERVGLYIAPWSFPLTL